MSLNFYASIDSFKNDNKDNTAITLKTGGASLDHQLDTLRTLKNDQVVHITFESAQIHYKENVDVETRKPATAYERDANGIWQATKIEDTTLDLDGVENTVSADFEVTADIVDNFLLSQKYVYDQDGEFKPLPILNKMAEGYDFDEIAKEADMGVTEMLDRLNKARQYFAPYAVAWMAERSDSDDTPENGYYER